MVIMSEEEHERIASQKEKLSSSSEEDEEESSSEDDEDGKEWTEEIEKNFLKTLSSLKRKDPKIYDTKVKFFNDEVAKQIDDEQPSSSKKKLKEERMYLRDYERKIILEKGGILTDEESDEESNYEKARERVASPTYVEEQKALKRSFKKFLNDDDECDGDDDAAGFLKVKVKNEKEKAQEEAEYIEWLKGQKSELSDKETEGELKYLRDYWTDPNLNEGEQFLRDYVLNKKYLDTNEENQFELEASFSEEEKVLNECEEYEHKYNFRFEEPDEEFIKTYPRFIEDSLRRREEKRKIKREARKQRKEAELGEKMLEIRRMQRQKKEEVMEKIEMLKRATGNDTLGFSVEDLEGNFNEEEFDKKMNAIFNDEFYNREDEDYPIAKDEDMDKEDLIMDCDYDPADTRVSKLKKTRSSKKKGHKRTTFADTVQREKPVFDPSDKTYQEYLDEYFALDCEDIVDDVPCRYKYREVIPNDFGLTIEEILAADDKELNNWCSMKKINTFRSDQSDKFDKKVYQKRANNLELKKKYLPSLFKNEDSAETTNQEGGKKKKKARRNRHQKQQIEVEKKNEFNDIKIESNVEFNNIKVENTCEKNINNKRKNRKRKAEGNFDGMSPGKQSMPGFSGSKKSKRGSNSNQPRNVADSDCAISNERLKAYGLNPKKYKNKIKYGQFGGNHR